MKMTMHYLDIREQFVLENASLKKWEESNEPKMQPITARVTPFSRNLGTKWTTHRWLAFAAAWAFLSETTLLNASEMSQSQQTLTLTTQVLIVNIAKNGGQ